jgi:DNA integrity scanning protein DisA with diadenylate cyclase activity
MATGTIGKKSVILKYFKDRQQTVADFAKELKQLSDEEELELAQGAAKELGYTQDQIGFPLD